MQCFGVSGYSGRGHHAERQERRRAVARQPDAVRADRGTCVHEREGRIAASPDRVRAAHWRRHFRGPTITANLHLSIAFDREVLARYHGRYGGSRWSGCRTRRRGVSWIGAHHVALGGFALSGDGLVVVATEDNLLKGARRPRPCRTSASHSASTRSPGFRWRTRHEASIVVAEAGVTVDARIQAFPRRRRRGPRTANSSLHDIAASAAHAEGLQRIGICPPMSSTG